MYKAIPFSCQEVKVKKIQMDLRYHELRGGAPLIDVGYGTGC